MQWRLGKGRLTGDHRRRRRRWLDELRQFMEAARAQIAKVIKATGIQAS